MLQARPLIGQMDLSLNPIGRQRHMVAIYLKSYISESRGGIGRQIYANYFQEIVLKV